MFIPRGFTLALLATPSGEKTLELTGKENPSFNLSTVESGLHTIVLISESRTLTHDSFEKFEKFAAEVGRGPEVASARRDGPIKEAYFRFAKSLIGVGDGAGQDRAYGAVYEWVALENPYDTTAGSLRFQINFEGKPSPNEPVQVFVRDLETGRETEPIHLMTNGEGVLILQDSIRGEIMLNSVKLLAVQNKEVEWISYWASVTFNQ